MPPVSLWSRGQTMVPEISKLSQAEPCVSTSYPGSTLTATVTGLMGQAPTCLRCEPCSHTCWHNCKGGCACARPPSRSDRIGASQPRGRQIHGRTGRSAPISSTSLRPGPRAQTPTCSLSALDLRIGLFGGDEVGKGGIGQLAQYASRPRTLPVGPRRKITLQWLMPP